MALLEFSFYLFVYFTIPFINFFFRFKFENKKELLILELLWEEKKPRK